MSSIHKGVPELQYQLGDCRDMHQFKEGEFPGAVKVWGSEGWEWLATPKPLSISIQQDLARLISLFSLSRALTGVLDKGTLDALMCGDAADRDSRAMLREVHRVLRPGGVYMMITSHSPKSRGRWVWKVWGWEGNLSGKCGTVMLTRGQK